MIAMNRKAFMATAALILAVALVQQADFAAANPIAAMYPRDPHTIVQLQSPKNLTKYSTPDINLVFSVDLSSWYPSYISVYNPSYRCSIRSVEYYIDGKVNGTITKNFDLIFLSEVYSVALHQLSQGEHSLEVKVETGGTYWHQVATINGTPAYGGPISAPVVDSSGLVHFTVDTIPTISNLSIENKVYTSHKIPLSFNVNEPISQVSCTLDNSSKMYFSGNTTLSVTEGEHSLVVYAKDTTGNLATSNMVFFTVDIPDSEPSPSPDLSPSPPSPSTTSEPTLHPSLSSAPTTEDSQTQDYTLPVISAVLVVIAAAFAALIYLKRRKNP